MTTFIKVMSSDDKKAGILSCVESIRAGLDDPNTFHVNPSEFKKVPGAPFAYWATKAIREIFTSHDKFEREGRLVRQGLSTADDFRFVRCWWEVKPENIGSTKENAEGHSWYPLLKGGGRSAFFSELDLVINYKYDGKELKSWVSSLYGNSGWSRNIVSTELYFRRGFSWSRRSNKFSPSAVPDGCIFSASRYQAFTSAEDLPWIISLLNSSVVTFLLKMCSERFEHPNYVVGIVSQLPFPTVSEQFKERLGELFREGVALKSLELSVKENSHFFMAPAQLRGKESLSGIKGGVEDIIYEIDSIAQDIYRLSESDMLTIRNAWSYQAISELEGLSDEVDAEENDSEEVDTSSDALISWAVGVAFGRFSLSSELAKSKAQQVDIDPFKPLPSKSPAMLSYSSRPFHHGTGILVDDLGHAYNLSTIVESVLDSAGVAVVEDFRRWLQRDFFSYHLKNYSKNRRKAPIYWPLSTSSGSYTLWLYYPSLSDQTLFTAVNDFLDPKLENVRKELQTLRDKGAGRSKQDEKNLEVLASLEHELADLRDSLLEIAPNYRPNHDDGVQITASPLWKLFRHKPWQKVLKDTWAKLEKGDYDWAHLAMNYWPDRVRDKCVTDKSLAIAHGLEHLYVAPEPVEKKTRGRKKAGSTE